MREVWRTDEDHDWYYDRGQWQVDCLCQMPTAHSWDSLSRKQAGWDVYVNG